MRRSVDEDYARQAQAVTRKMAALAERSAENAERDNARVQLLAELQNEREKAMVDAQIQATKNELLYNATAYTELAHVRAVKELRDLFGNSSEHVLKYLWIQSLSGSEKWIIPHNLSVRLDHL